MNAIDTDMATPGAMTPVQHLEALRDAADSYIIARINAEGYAVKIGVDDPDAEPFTEEVRRFDDLIISQVAAEGTLMSRVLLLIGSGVLDSCINVMRGAPIERT